MIRLPLALVLLIPLCARADDFAAALAGIQETARVQFAQGRSAPTRPKPAPQPAALPAASDADWAKIVAAVKKDGKYTSGAFIMPATFSLEEKTGDPKGDHQTRAVTFLGAINDDDKFEAMGAMIVWMDYKLDAATGNFNAEQWMFEVDLYGQVTDMGRMTAVIGPDGKRPIAPPAQEKLQPGDPRVKTQFDAQIAFWAGK